MGIKLNILCCQGSTLLRWVVNERHEMEISWLEPTGNLVSLFIIVLTEANWFLFLDWPAECILKAERDENRFPSSEGWTTPQLLWCCKSRLAVWVKVESSWESQAVADPTLMTRSLVQTLRPKLITTCLFYFDVNRLLKKSREAFQLK